MKLSAPFLTKLLIPDHMSKSLFTRYGINSKDIIQYNAMDELVIINNKKIPSKLPKMKLNKKKTILFRTYESQAGYIHQHTDLYKIINSLIKNFADYNILVLGRYADEIKLLKKKYLNQDIIIFDKVVDSQAILPLVDLFIGSGGTMTTENTIIRNLNEYFVTQHRRNITTIQIFSLCRIWDVSKLIFRHFL